MEKEGVQVVNMNDIEKFLECFSELKEDSSIAIYTHPIPDPDALSSAWGIKWLLKKKLDLDVVIVCDGSLSHPQNITMQTLLQVPFVREDTTDPNSFSKIILVDAVPANSSLDKADIVIDHHDNEVEVDCEFTLLRKVGSCATIIYNMIKAAGLNFEDEDEERLDDLATALFLGIRTDTSELVSDKTCEDDFKAYQELSVFVDRSKLFRIINYPLPTYYLDLERTLSDECNHIKQDTVFIGGVGVITEKKKDCLAMLADKMIRIEGIETSIIFALIDDFLQVSIRSKSSSINVKEFSRDLFGCKYAGGRKGSGGARVPIHPLKITSSSDKMIEEIWVTMKNSIFEQVKSKITGG